MAEWPDLDELKQLLDITSDDWDGDGDGTRLARVLSSAIDHAKELIAGTVDAYDDLYEDPTSRHAQLALRVAELLATRPAADVTIGGRSSLPRVLEDPTIKRLLFGQRRVFGIA